MARQGYIVRLLKTKTTRSQTYSTAHISGFAQEQVYKGPGGGELRRRPRGFSIPPVSLQGKRQLSQFWKLKAWWEPDLGFLPIISATWKPEARESQVQGLCRLQSKFTASPGNSAMPGYQIKRVGDLWKNAFVAACECGLKVHTHY